VSLSSSEFTRSTCPYCGVGCGVVIETQRDAQGLAQVVGVKGDELHPANFGRLCTKGSTLHLTAQPLRQMQVRATEPLIRSSKTSPMQSASWPEALDHIAHRFAACIAEHGPDSVAFYISGQLLTEDYYVFNKIAKALIGTNNVDTNSRLCMSSAVAGYKQTLGADAPPLTYVDVEQASTLFITGSNTAFAHPVLFRRIEAARAARPDMKLIVVDPRRTDTAAEADLHLAIQPGTDVALYNSMLHLMLWEGWIDRAYIEAHTEGFEALRELVRDYTPQRAAQICGVPVKSIEQATQWFATSPGTVSLYCQGLNQSTAGTANNAALINLHLASRQIGRLGAGPFSLTGQPNAMGGREVGGLANLLPAHRDLANAEHRQEVAEFWGVKPLQATPGLSAVELFEAIENGKVKMVWIACTNPAQSMPDVTRVHAALAKAELVILQEAYRHTATYKYADVLLPATTWAEKDGTVTNSERRISRVKAAASAPGSARHDWAIAVDFAQRLEQCLAVRGLDRRISPDIQLFNYPDPQSIWEEHRETTRGRDLDITGLSYRILEERGPQLWPFREGQATGQARLYEDGVFVTASGKARFVAVAYKPTAEVVDARYPIALGTGRLRDQWHGMSRTGTVGQLFSHAPEPAIELAASDMAQRRLLEGQLVRVRSRRGEMVLPVRASAAQKPGSGFIAMHWGGEFVAGGGVNALTQPAYCPSSRQPELKHSAVRIEAAELPFRLVCFGWVAPERHLVVRHTLLAYFNAQGFASAVSFGREHDGVLLRVAHHEALPAEALAFVQSQFQVDAENLLRYEDPRKQSVRRLSIEQGVLRFVMLAGDAAPEQWLREFLENATSVTALGRALLMPSVHAPQGFVSRGRTICNCFGVSEQQIQAVIVHGSKSAQERLQMVQQALSCGTSCGSCLPELRRLTAD
jgi:assimilatory nitrate reductase catalytic subunit